MPRIITYTTSSVLRLFVVHHECGMYLCARSPPGTHGCLTFSKTTTTPPSIQSPHHTQPRKVKSLCKMFPQSLRLGVTTCSRKQKKISQKTCRELDLSTCLRILHSRERRQDIDAKPAPMPLGKHDDLSGGAHVEASALGAASSIVADMKVSQRETSKLDVDRRTCS